MLKYPIIGLTGRAGAGKDTVANFGIEYCQARDISAVKIGCADALKGLCAGIFGAAFGVTAPHFYGSQEEKERPLESIPGWTGRRILQHVGTEGFRHIHPEIWVRLMLESARSHLEDELLDTRLVFVSDVRFIGEANAIQQAGGLVVRVKNPNADHVVATHSSELDVANIREDYVIDNQGRELYLLQNLVKDFLCQLHF